MITARSLVVAIALVAAGTVAAAAQGYGQGYGPGWRQAGGPCAAGQGSPCLRLKNPDRHAACWKEADAKGLRASARRGFMTSCMTP